MMARIERFEEMEAWKGARELTKMVYEATSVGRFASDFGLKDQIRRAAVSVLSNIAEGFERGGNKEFLQFLATAKGSCGEVRAQLYVALDQSYLNDAQWSAISNKSLEVSRMISGFIRYLRQTDMVGSKFKVQGSKSESRS
jgi:four helix bundle protein